MNLCYPGVDCMRDSSGSFVPVYYSSVLEVKVISVKFKTVSYCLRFSCSNNKCNSGLI